MQRLSYSLIFAGLLASPLANALECDIGTVKEWSSGFVINDIVVTNTTNKTINDWSARIAVGSKVLVTKSWGMNISANNTAEVYADPVASKSTLAAGKSTRFGFKGSKQGQLGQVNCDVVTSVNDTPDVPTKPEPSVPETKPQPEVPNNGSEIFLEDFSTSQGGAQWHGLDESTIVSCGGNRGNCLQITYEPTSRGSDRVQTSVDIPAGNHYSLSYDIYFAPGFEFVKGGKLPGLSPENHTTGCKPITAEGWSVRPMWRRNGSAQAYHYHQDRSGRCGDGDTSAAATFKVGQWQTVEVDVKLNSNGSLADGHVDLKIDGQSVSRANNVRLHRKFDNSSQIRHLFFSTFYGGADTSWAPSKTTYIRYDNFKVTDLTEAKNIVSGEDQCNTTSQCSAVWPNATDCADSRSAQSVCMCGGASCESLPAQAIVEQPAENNDSGTCTLNQQAQGIPSISIFSPTSKSVARKDFCSIKKWYAESSNKQVFTLHKGDNFADNVAGGRQHARIEAQHGLTFKPSDTWHEFEATMQFDVKPDITITIAQLFAGCCGPDARIEIKPNGRIHVGSLVDGNVRISDDQSYIGKPFRVKIRSNGKRVEVYFNGTKKYANQTRRNKIGTGGKTLLYHFRWGVYSNEIPKKKLTNIVTNVKRK